jgi:signal transduction histidine kinase
MLGVDLTAVVGAEPAERLDPTGRRRDLRLALSCLGGGLLLLALGVNDSGATQPRYLLVFPLVAVCAALLARRVAPLPAVVVGVAAGYADAALGPSLGTLLIFAQLIYDAALYGRRWLAPWLLRGAVAATVVVSLTFLALGRTQNAAAWGVTLTLVAVLPVVTAFPVRQHRERARLERDRAEQVARLAELDRRQAVAAERARMARELHDVVANHFSAVAIHATAALTLRDLDPATLREILTVMRDNSVRGLAEMRELVELLRDPGDPDAVVPANLARLAEVATLVDTVPGVTAKLEIDGVPRDLPAAVDLAAYRIAQESLTNAGRHAAGGSVLVRIGYGEDRVVITVDSCGAPGGSAPAGVCGAGMGLAGMRERAALLGGTLTAGPSAAGWRVRAVLPVAALPAAALPEESD